MAERIKCIYLFVLPTKNIYWASILCQNWVRLGDIQVDQTITGQWKEGLEQWSSKNKETKEKKEVDGVGKSQTTPNLKASDREFGVCAEGDWKPLKGIGQGSEWHEDKLGGKKRMDEMRIIT